MTAKTKPIHLKVTGHTNSIVTIDNGVITSRSYLSDFNTLHCDDYPAFTSTDGLHVYMKNGKHHRIGSPAVIYTYGAVEYAIDGHFLPKHVYDQLVQYPNAYTDEVIVKKQNGYLEFSIPGGVGGTRSSRHGAAVYFYETGKFLYYIGGVLMTKDVWEDARHIFEIEDTTGSQWVDSRSGKLSRIAEATGCIGTYQMPAVMIKDGSWYRREYWINGKRHRVDGPAVITVDGSYKKYEYWINGEQVESFTDKL